MKQEFPHLTHLELPLYNIHYPKQEGVLFALSFLIQLPRIVWTIWKEHQVLSKWVPEKNIQFVISDNRYGLFYSKVPTAFITHQLFVITPFAQVLLEKIMHFFWQRYQEIWVPDLGGEKNLSGTLSHKSPLPKALAKKVHYLGPLSRMNLNKGYKIKKNKVLAIISGPDPQRTLLEKSVLEQLQNCAGNHIVVGGMPEIPPKKVVQETEGKSTITHYSHLSQQELEEQLRQSEVVLCRSGYTTIMELCVLQQEGLVFIPTPGQTEQEYLCEHLQYQKVAPYQKQKELNLPQLLEKQVQGGYCGFKAKNWDTVQEGIEQNFLEQFLAKHPLLNKLQ